MKCREVHPKFPQEEVPGQGQSAAGMTQIAVAEKLAQRKQFKLNAAKVRVSRAVKSGRLKNINGKIDFGSALVWIELQECLEKRDDFTID